MKKILLLLFILTAFLKTGMSQVVYDSTTLNNGNITSNTTLNGTTVYILKGFVYVTNGVTLFIPAGTIILGDKPTTGTLIIERGGKIYANGTPSQPILFTTRQPAGQRGPGDWGGVILLGRASINTVSGADTSAIEGLPPTTRAAYYGGHDDSDSSGVMRYCRIEFPGINLTGVSGNEINGLTMGGVGNKTLIEYVQVSYSGDDSFEWFGGTVNARYLIAYKGVDDDFDTDNGFRGNCQFLLGVRDSAIADVSGSNGFESDNNANSPNNFNAPRTKPIYSNITIVGPKKDLGWSVNANFKRAMHIRRNCLTSSFNSIFMAYPVGVRFDGNGVATACLNDTLRIQNNIFAGNNTLADTASITIAFNGPNWLQTSSFNNRVYAVNDSVKLTNPFNIYGNSPAPNYMPLTGSPALTGSSFSNSFLSNSFFQNVSFVGAFGSTDWSLSWSNFNPQYYTIPIGVQKISAETPATYLLTQNYPNPFNPSTTIKFALPYAGLVTLKVYNEQGKEVKTLVDGIQQVGTYKVNFDASNLSSGIYFYKIFVSGSKSESWAQTKKMVLVK
jgi:hypothetical protein